MHIGFGLLQALNDVFDGFVDAPHLVQFTPQRLIASLCGCVARLGALRP